MHPSARPAGRRPLVGRGVARARRSRERVGRSGVRAAPGIVVLPRYDPGAPTALTPLSDTEAFFYLALNAVNLLATRRDGTAALGTLRHPLHLCPR